MRRNDLLSSSLSRARTGSDDTGVKDFQNLSAVLPEEECPVTVRPFLDRFETMTGKGENSNLYGKQNLHNQSSRIDDNGALQPPIVHDGDGGCNGGCGNRAAFVA